MAVPAKWGAKFVVQDDRGFRANVRINAYLPHIDTTTTTLATVESDISAIGTAVQGITNAKVVSTGFFAEWDLAQEPSSETGTYQLVQQKASLLFGDGNVSRQRMLLPAPIDGLFLTTSQDNLIVVDPTAAGLAALQTAVNAVFNSTSGGQTFAQFFGGQLVQGKARRRRVLQGA